jgi:RNA polymerase sigma-70 factor (ECF subfamily)
MDTEEALLDAAKRMNKDALVEMFELYAPALYKYAFCLCCDTLLADHIVGDVFAKLLEHLSDGTGPSAHLRTYLYRMTYHLVVDAARHSRRFAPLEVVDFTHQDANSTDVSIENQLLLEAVLRAIQRKLTEDQQHVIILRFLEGFSLKETAAILGKELSNVKVIQTRAISTLRRAL